MHKRAKILSAAGQHGCQRSECTTGRWVLSVVQYYPASHLATNILTGVSWYFDRGKGCPLPSDTVKSEKLLLADAEEEQLAIATIAPRITIVLRSMLRSSLPFAAIDDLELQVDGALCCGGTRRPRVLRMHRKQFSNFISLACFRVFPVPVKRKSNETRYHCFTTGAHTNLRYVYIQHDTRHDDRSATIGRRRSELRASGSLFMMTGGIKEFAVI